MGEKMPIFVKMDDYNEVLSLLSEIKVKIDDMHATLDSLEELKVKEDSEIEAWRKGIEDVQDKMQVIDQTLFEPENLSS